MVAALTIFLAGGFVQYVRSGGAFDLQREWGAIVFLLLPIGVAAMFVRGFIRHRREHPRYDLSILDGLRALIDENRLARARLRVSMSVLTVAMALVPVMTYQLQLVGKQRPHEAASMLVVFGVAYVVAMAWQLWKYRRKLLPENSRLQELFKSYEQVSRAPHPRTDRFPVRAARAERRASAYHRDFEDISREAGMHRGSRDGGFSRSQWLRC